MPDLRILSNRAILAAKKAMKRAANAVGYDIVKRAESGIQMQFPPDFTPDHIAILKAAQP